MATQQSLFGATPESLQQARAAALNTEAAQYAQMDPFERANFGLYKGANQLAGAVGGMLGGQDPQMLQMQKRQQLLQGIDQTNPQAWLQLASKLSGVNDFAGAQEAVGRAQALQKTALEGRKTEAEIGAKLGERSTTEMKNAAALAGTVAQPGTPEWTAAFNKELARLNTKEGTRDQIKEVGVAEGTRKPVYTYQTAGGVKQVVFAPDPADSSKQIMVPYAGGVDRTTAKVSATASNQGASAGAEEIAKLEARRIQGAFEASDKALTQAGNIKQLLSTPQPLSGSGAPARVAALRVFDTLGLASAKDKSALQNADMFNSLAGENVISFIKQLGVNPTDNDLAFAKAIGPALEKGERTNQDLLNYLLKRAETVAQVAPQMEEHFYKNNYSLKGFKSPLMENIKQPSLSGMTDAQLMEAYRKQKGK